jgi:hypothetical protein
MPDVSREVLFDDGFAPSSGRQARDDAAAGTVMFQNGNTLYQNGDIAAILL